jgi:hypothetical protein
MKSRIFWTMLASIATVIPEIAFAQSGSPAFLKENQLAIAILIFLYLLPAWIAWSRKHQNKGPIILIDVFLGWTVIGWIVALIWSVGSTKKDTVVVLPAQPADNALPSSQTPLLAIPVANKTIGERIADLKSMLDSGAITQNEYEVLKADALNSLAQP